MDLNGPAEATTDDTFVKVTLSKVVKGLTDDRKKVKSLLAARHVTVFKNFCILHYKSVEAANAACDKIMSSKFKPASATKSKAKQSTLKFAKQKKEKAFAVGDLAAVAEKVDILEGEEKARHLGTVEKRRERFKKWRN